MSQAEKNRGNGAKTDRPTQPADTGREDGERHRRDETGPDESTPEVDWKERYIRLAADFDNFRKRVRQEEKDAVRRERIKVMEKWLEAFDSTQRALESVDDQDSPWFSGLESILHQMEHVIASLGAERIPTDIPFDPNLHEALSVVPASGKENGTILHTERSGFVFSEDGRVLRPARVVVARG